MTVVDMDIDLVDKKMPMEQSVGISFFAFNLKQTV